MKRFEWYLGNENEVQDSMCYDSGTFICSYGSDDNFVQVVVRGYVKVDYKGGRYRYATNMPDELVQMFRDGSAYKPDSEVELLENNWLEIELVQDHDCIHGDVLEVGTPATKEEMEKVCKDVWLQWNKELHLIKEDNNAN